VTATFEDTWAFRTPGAGPHDFPTMLAAMRAAGRLANQPPVARALFAIRWKLGALLGWDDPAAGVGVRVASLRDRLPEDLRRAPRGPDGEGLSLTLVHDLDRECAREPANKTVHTVMHAVPAPRRPPRPGNGPGGNATGSRRRAANGEPARARSQERARRCAVRCNPAVLVGVPADVGIRLDGASA
jgi:hypothetical protein